MKIESSQLQLAARHSSQEHTSVQVTMDEVTSPSSPPPAASLSASRSVGNLSSFSNTSASSVVQLSQQGRDAAEATNVSALPVDASGPTDDPFDTDDKLKADLRYQLIKSLFEQITGTHFQESNFELNLAAGGASPSPDVAAQHASDAVATPNPASPPNTPQIRQTRTEIRTESEQTNFKAQGKVTTADGRKIDFSVDLTLQRSHSEQSTQHLLNGKLVDPLVINLDGQQVALREGSVSFDLNSDGQTEQIHFVNEGSAFLALDKNGDGNINNGSELFGTQSGDGFQDLAAYDDDQNQVIDENDAVFSQLRLYNKDANGNDQLTTLAESGIGAIFLNNTATPFSLKDGQNQLQAQVRSSGVFLYESGKAGAVQQVDLVV